MISRISTKLLRTPRGIGLSLLLLYVGVRAAFFLFLRGIVGTFPNAHAGQAPEFAFYLDNPFGMALMGWDGGWYRRIVLEGYSGDGRAAFFPVFPYAVRAIAYVTHAPWTSAIILNVVLAFGAMLFLERWVRRKDGAQAGRDAALLLLLSPGAIFFCVLYTEATFCFFVAGFFCLLEERRFVLAAIFGACATATRSTGIFLVPALGFATLVEALVRRGWPEHVWKKVLLSLFIPIGLLAFMALLKVELGDPFAFAKVQEKWGRTNGHMPWDTILRELKEPSYGDMLYRVDALSAVAATFIGLWSWFRRDVLGGTFLLLCAVVPLTTGTSMSITRFLVVVPVVYRAFAALTTRFPRLRPPVFAAFGFSSAYLGACFVLGYWAG